ncbi:MAG TPA: hemolysin family protein [Clostridiales bacterium]|nr:MAG: Magnesium and cobalt efflux protein CorC [Firmicutes bacterium ADurb.Bin262]HOU09618.1 hemolysin family protein [Clostridiales bacterium]HQK74122.1 hemolysin family protein [Clostridiales bacterium]
MDDPGSEPAAGFILQILAASGGSSAAGVTATEITLKILLLLFLILVNAFFAMSEIAIISLNDNKIQKMADEGNKKARQIVRLTSNPSNFLSTIQIGVTLAGFLASASAAKSFADPLTQWMLSAGGAALHPYASLISGVFIVVITLLVSFFSLVLGELAPKRIAMQIPEKVAYKAVGPLLFVARAAKPFIRLLSFSTNSVVRLLGFNPNASQNTVTEEEIRMMVDAGGEHGVIEDDQKEMIFNVFEFDDIYVSDIMTHRTDMAAVEANDPLADAVSIAINDGYSRIPVYDDEPDNIIGIIYVKDLLKYVGSSLPEEKTLRDIMREAYYVPETKRCGELFKEMTARHVQMAIVVDEYGGTAGLVTLEDLLETIVGNIQDEYDNEDEEIAKINETTFTVEGTTSIDEIDDIVGAELPEGDYDTVAGFVISLLGFLPKDGDLNTAEYKNLRFTVLSVEDRRIGKIKIEIMPSEQKDGNSREKDAERQAP